MTAELFHVECLATPADASPAGGCCLRTHLVAAGADISQVQALLGIKTAP